jgi:NarL family two-component system response regulator LiaR
MSDPPPIRVLIVDDHYMVREGLKSFFSTVADVEVVAEGKDGVEAIALAEVHRPDVIVMDVVMPNTDGPTATGIIKERWPDTRIVGLTSFAEEDLARVMLGAGAIGYILKDASPEKLLAAVRDAQQGRGTVDTAVLGTLLTQGKDGPLVVGSDLTPREREVLGLVVAGFTNKQIAAHLFLSAGTVRLHVSNILAKLGASNRTEAATIAMQHHLSP